VSKRLDLYDAIDPPEIESFCSPRPKITAVATDPGYIRAGERQLLRQKVEQEVKGTQT